MPELQVQTGAQKGQVLFLRPPGPVLVGRDLDADFPIFDRRASRNHFRIDFTDEGYRITDLGSRAGTIVNDEKIKSAILTHDSHILVGKTVLVFGCPIQDDPLIGRDLGGYQVLERVGSGGMGVVYRALQKSLDRVVALKVLPRKLTRDEEFCRLFVEEARAAAKLSHPNIVHVYDVNVAEDVLFYAMEYMAHGSVGDLCQAHGSLSPEDATGIALDAARGLDFARQKGIVHQDIKPSNLMIHENGTVKIVDLGIAMHFRDSDSSASNRGLRGSPHYMSPEQVLRESVDPRADIYALGASVFRMLAGRPPFEGRTIKEILFARIRGAPPDLLGIRPDIPPALAALVGRMLSRDPGDRPPTAADVVQELQAIRSVLLPRSGVQPPDALVRWGRRAFVAALVPVLFGTGYMLGSAFAQLRWKIRVRRATIDQIREVLADAERLLKAGDLEGARRRRRELARLPGFRDDWDLLQREISAFDKALQTAEAPEPEDNGGLH